MSWPNIGLQATANFAPNFSGVVQVITQQRFDDSYVPTIEWANLKYQFTPDLSARIGRIALPTFLVSDYRTVGYAIPWIRTPVLGISTASAGSHGSVRCAPGGLDPPNGTSVQL